MPHKEIAGRRNLVEKARRERYKAAGLCFSCGGVRDTELLQCSKCRERQHQGDQKRKRAGLCLICGAPAADKSGRCPTCKDQRRQEQQKRREEGYCADCGVRPAATGYKLCEVCRERGRAKVRALKAQVFEAYGGLRCACCGETQFEFLQLDHINGGGAEHRKSGLMGSPLYTKLRREGFPPGYQVLCANCNFAKGHLGYCPHRPPVNLSQADKS